MKTCAEHNNQPLLFRYCKFCVEEMTQQSAELTKAKEELNREKAALSVSCKIIEYHEARLITRTAERDGLIKALEHVGCQDIQKCLDDDPEPCIVCQALSPTRQEEKMWECGECGFRMSATHEDEGGGYTCPNCPDPQQSARDRVIEAAKEAAEEQHTQHCAGNDFGEMPSSQDCDCPLPKLRQILSDMERGA